MCKDQTPALEKKFGNFNTPIIMKLVNKFNQKQISKELKLNDKEVAGTVKQQLNYHLKRDGAASQIDFKELQLVFSEIREF